jgi:hypothetical protein
MAYVVVIEVAEEFDLTQNALGIDQIIERVRDFLDSHLTTGGFVDGRTAGHTTSDRITSHATT